MSFSLTIAITTHSAWAQAKLKKFAMLICHIMSVLYGKENSRTTVGVNSFTYLSPKAPRKLQGTYEVEVISKTLASPQNNYFCTYSMLRPQVLCASYYICMSCYHGFPRNQGPSPPRQAHHSCPLYRWC